MSSTTDSQDADFIARHIGPREPDIAAMLSSIGYDSLDDLVQAAVPESIRSHESLDLPAPRSEVAVVQRLKELAAKNEVFASMIGMGYYGTITPSVIQRNVLENPGWYTAYTPYQPEISQGRLEAIINFQTMVADLTGMEISNASLLDEGTAAAEAMAMLHRLSKGRRGGIFFVDQDALPQTIEVLRTRAEPLGLTLIVGDPVTDLPDVEPFGVLLQYPGVSGAIADTAPIVASCQERGIKVAMAADLLALTLLVSPGELGADVAVGTSQRFGVPMMFGGPHAGYIATKDEYKRALPGRLVGVSKDADGRVGYRLTLATREQHIRREKATSNICTAQVLLAVMAGMYGVYHGPDGITAIATRIHGDMSALVAGLEAAGVEVKNNTFFDTITVSVPHRADEILAKARERRINFRFVDNDTVGISFDETTTAPFVDAVLEIFGAQHAGEKTTGIPRSLLRTSNFMEHPVFHSYRSETEMMRYLRKLQDKDIALDRAMIPLGSCTMKLNAATEMAAVTWPEFGNLHPFIPLDQAAGYLELFDEVETWLGEITGYDAVSLQPNAGSQGEFSGLLAIRAYHQSRGDHDRTVCLIPASAHGTNPASAAMAGMKVVVVNTDEYGNIDLSDLRDKAVEHADSLAALMVTYPSTHGVFEEGIVEACDIVHENGGQVYLDGANLNAMVGLAKPGKFGGDVSHLNLHKTFAIPHGGGGPGVGPIGVKKHLAPFLPGHGLVPDQDDHRDGVGAVASAPWGSAGVLSISWAYMALLGGSGLTKSTKVAILSANYIARRLSAHYPLLFTGNAGLVAHECIIDLRPIKDEVGVTVDDFAKRLIDYGFHAPTMSFPVVGTLMIEPTESESLEELDRFCDAMIAIRAEVDLVADGTYPLDDSPLSNAPHPAENLLVDEWVHPYSREVAAYPVAGLRADKYWPPVSRIDNQYGDRNVMCSCPPIDAYLE
ncbi:MAG: aminomethyl-transferring glycine dehydrogenase [Acidobacteria bacterium]|nr:aminomethyl-transferring glycine dehydrogenase [Acidobacteriota bacterium]